MEQELSDICLDDILVGDKRIIIYNDDYNTFEHVEFCLQTVLGHSFEQAQQCTLLIHYKGKCDVKKGEESILISKCEQLISYGLDARIE